MITQMICLIAFSFLYSKSIEYDVIENQNRSLSDPTLSAIDFKNKIAWVWTTLKIIFIYTAHYNKTVIHKSQFDQRNRL